MRFSVLIPVRNEAQNIESLLQDLALQDFDIKNFEVLVLDDNSEDDTAKIVRNCISKVPYSLRLISVPQSNSAHKKRAITLGVSKSNFEYIITTDGDCRLRATWLSSFATFFTQKNKTQNPAYFVAGGVRLNHTRDFFAAFQAAEFATLIGCGGAALNLGYPFTCNGANMAYSKKVFEELGGYQNGESQLENGYKISSGDDEFLLHKFYQHYPKNIFFLKSVSATVQTEATKTWKEFYHQRKRWVSKWNQHKKISHALISIFVFVVQLTTLFIPLIFWKQDFFTIQALLGFTLIVKMVLEFLFLVLVLHFLKQKRAIAALPIWWCLYSFYTVFFGLVVQKKGYIWKGRKTK